MWHELRNMIGWWSCDLNQAIWLVVGHMTWTLLVGYLSWSRNAAICAGVAATIRIIDSELPVSGDVVMGELKGREERKEEGGRWGEGRREGGGRRREGERRGGMGEWVGRGGVLPESLETKQRLLVVDGLTIVRGLFQGQGWPGNEFLYETSVLQAVGLTKCVSFECLHNPFSNCASFNGTMDPF